MQKIVVVFLALLQLAAPLVHAHVGTELSEPGWHIPALESFSAGTDDHENSSMTGKFHLQNQVISIVVGSAIVKKQLNGNSSPEHQLFFIASAILAACARAAVPLPYFSTPPLPYSFYGASYSTRAPPAVA